MATTSAVPESQERPIGTFAATPKVPANRLVSLDVFRGATMASMVLVNNAGDWEHIYTPFEHSPWSGWTFTDTVFPFFLWIVGVAITLSFARRVERGDDRGKLFLHVLRRAVIIFAIGTFLSAFPKFDFTHLRYLGVLQRIAICYFVASTLFLFLKVRGLIVSIFVLLLSYWLLMSFVPVPGCGAGSYSMQCNLERYVDGIVLNGHMYTGSKFWDPEGTISTLPSIATALLGILTGFLLRKNVSGAERTVWIFLSGNLLIFAGLILNTWQPINKNLWTDSFCLFMAGLASVVFAMYYWIVDVLKYQKWARAFAILGMNAIAVYIMNGLVDRVLGINMIPGPNGRSIALETWLYNTFFVPLSNPYNASLLWAFANVLFYFGIAWIMYRRGWFLRF